MARNKPFVVAVSSGLKQAIEQAAGNADVTMSDWARDVIARACGYDLANDDALDGRGRPRVYASAKEKGKAKRAAAKRRDMERQAVVDAVMRQNRLADAAALEAWLKQRGISLDDEAVEQAV